MRREDGIGAGLPIGIVAFFVVLHVVLYGWIVPTDAWMGGGDLPTYLDPALGLYRHGAFVQPDDPSQASLYRLPLYTVVTAGALWLADGETPRLVVVANLAMLLVTGLLTWRVALAWVPRRAALVLVLVLFNPLAVGTAYILQPLNLNAMLFAVAGWLLLREREPPTVVDILCVGLVVGLSALTRPAGQLLIAALPFGIPVLAYLMGQRQAFVRTVGASIVASAIGIAAILPWMLYAEARGHGLRLSSVEHNTLFLRDNVSSLEFHRGGGSLQDAKNRIIADISAWQTAEGASFDALSSAEKSARRNDYLMSRFADYPVSTIAKAWSISLANLFFGAGSTNLRTMLDVEAPKAWEMIVLQPGYNYVTAFFAALGQSSPVSIFISIFGVGYFLICRIFDLTGLWVAARRGDWAPLVVIVGLSALFGVVHVFVGESIYRVPIEPYLVLLAAYGIDGALSRADRRD